VLDKSTSLLFSEPKRSIFYSNLLIGTNFAKPYISSPRIFEKQRISKLPKGGQ